MYVSAAAAKIGSEDAPIIQPNTKPSISKAPEDINDEMTNNWNDPSELYTQPSEET